MFGIVKPAVWPSEAKSESVEQVVETEATASNPMTIPVAPAATESDVEVIEYERLVGESEE